MRGWRREDIVGDRQEETRRDRKRGEERGGEGKARQGNESKTAARAAQLRPKAETQG
jgi:hypothetical protein